MARSKFFKWTAFLILTGLLAILPMHFSKHEATVGADDEYASLVNEINQILQDERLDGALAGVSIREADSGEKIYDHIGTTRLVPASNMKLFTAAAAFETLGEDYRFTTEVHTDGTVKGKMLHGNLYLKGKGDPTLLQEDFEQFALALKSQGIKKIKGDLIGDDTWYDDVRLSEDITWQDEVYYYGAQVSALTASPNEDYDAGSVIVEVNPGDLAGAEPKVSLTPQTDYVTIVNHAKTVAAEQPKTVSISREHGTNQIVIEGNIPVEGSRTREWIAVDEPSGYALDLFENALIAQGIEWAGKHSVTMGETPADSTLLLEHESMTLSEFSIPFMKLSNNGHGEVLTKEMGRVVQGTGSWEAGLEVMENVAGELGVNTETILLRDGSGMSHVNLIPVNEVSQLLFGAQNKSWFDSYLNALPVAGAPERFVGGTLRNRMKETAAQQNVKAKTGTLTAVSALSGYATTKDGKPLIFSIIINNDLSTVTPIEDAIATAIAEWDAE
ncbi:D-alanyl-D-alanine carboxypeptidase/D-alanyl-D-alanine-endopeptidase (penicillin-binding protein 4) [Planomicrobium stackebrandtii]|uniref:D-alanyl-D-alanine carboxypeptidase/D-alanyl-D-alanine-endopeptidase (Penicillin-binding protein 4) n=1 Tax=Planomicrobium stackebrandtii TaxID=253160 RepID=A0ABU0GRZ3_9BACL|nr:D-alanyl-D-alanine carboxypeptidase/D-alanyl-D-alanine-endopeptidase [Planomicrobium stackebrandtii]MDQ0428133.1 D-alanyl-D-alanine carboxypeptidase/D-alanyl-D-alanine-endopeptidase (penicillin-binding protein 4) [Planomicrobium stackebrandtii]